jgi:hypothetical protein
MIKQLQEEIVQKDNALKKAAEDMKFYKLELINREQSYNQMFGTNPNVGVINPVAAAKAGASGKTATTVANVKPGGMGIGMGIGGGAPPTAMAAKSGDPRSQKSRLV